ncbi:hypothetical protein PQ455_12785 [Sphingomonas naphthae]|uniref:Uncharacterized protein n=1 Tax=Sphingomonas naphthae TaxID=1813468 RepID=A0ABY7TIF7_9SPHN|nr:hypothetical protein [Sphingomonas naphthae]WCT72507.1 hypothetical protein PQ455_12785 [Sphingomonas naphthae]
MPGVPPLIPSLLVIGAILMTLGGVAAARRPEDRKRGILMLVCAAVMLGNALLLGLPL